MLNQPTIFAQQIVEILDTQNIEAFVQLFTLNAELILPDARCAGRDAIRAAVMGLYQVYDDISISLERVMAQDDVAFIQWRWCDRKLQTGQIHETDTVIVLDLEGDLIKRWREFHAPVLK